MSLHDESRDQLRLAVVEQQKILRIEVPYYLTPAVPRDNRHLYEVGPRLERYRHVVRHNFRGRLIRAGRGLTVGAKQAQRRQQPETTRYTISGKRMADRKSTRLNSS